MLSFGLWNLEGIGSTYETTAAAINAGPTFRKTLSCLLFTLYWSFDSCRSIFSCLKSIKIKISRIR